MVKKAQSGLRLFGILAVSLAAVGFSGGAIAQSTGSSGSGGMTGGMMSYLPGMTPGSSYIGLNVGRTNYSLGGGTGLYPTDEKDTSYGLNVGSFFNNYLGAEIGFTDLGDSTRGGGVSQAYGFNISAIGRLPVSDTFNLLGKLGTTYSRSEVSSSFGSGITAGKESGWGLSYGIGAEYVFTPQVSAVLQYDEHQIKFINSDRERIGTTSVGLRLRF